MRALVQQLLRGPSPLSPAEREHIAAHVSAGNRCRYCTRSHAAIARKLGADLSKPSPKLRALLSIAHAVASKLGPVPPALIDQAKACGADDLTIHDTVLIAAAFSMFNRYVDAMGADTPDESDPSYAATAERLTTKGYVP
jgi:AhpD family alkylhydroperoxidase